MRDRKMSKRKRSDSDNKQSKKGKSAKTTITKHEKELLNELSKREIKYTTYAATHTCAQVSIAGALATSALVFGSVPLNFVAVGDNNNQRTGKKISVNNVRLRIMLEWVPEINAGSFATPEPVRMILFIDKTPNGSAPFNGSPESLMLNSRGLISMTNTDTLGRFQILQDETVMPEFGQNYSSVTGSADYGGLFRCYKMSHKFKKGGLVTNFNANVSADVRQMVDNCIYLAVFTGDLNQVGVTINAQSRISFVDL